MYGIKGRYKKKHKRSMQITPKKNKKKGRTLELRKKNIIH